MPARAPQSVPVTGLLALHLAVKLLLESESDFNFPRMRQGNQHESFYFGKIAAITKMEEDSSQGGWKELRGLNAYDHISFVRFTAAFTRS